MKMWWGFEVTLDLSDMFPLHNANDLVFTDEFRGETLEQAWFSVVDNYKNIKNIKYIGYCNLY